MNFRDRLKDNRPIVLDGGMGSLIFQKAPDYKGCFELLNVERPEIISEIHDKYINAGAEIIETNSFGGNKIKLAEYGLSDRCIEINRKAVEVAKKVSSGKAFVAGSAGPTGKLVHPIGDAYYDEIYDAYKDQMIGFQQGGADLIVIETMSDVQEAKIALHAAKQNTSLPVIVSLTFEKNGKTISGTDLLTGFVILSQNGADVVGINCSLGPSMIYEFVKNYSSEIRSLGIPFSIWANAGIPYVENGKTFYPLSPEEFADQTLRFTGFGFKILGGCCGTNPDHIKCLKDKMENTVVPEKNAVKNNNYAASRYSIFNFSKSLEVVKIGERLNPSARKLFKEDLLTGKTDFLRAEAKLQQSEGADIIDINVGVPGIDETLAMKTAVSILSNIVQTPVMIDSDNYGVLETALKTYPGIPVVNSINGKEKNYSSIIPLLKKYGCFVVALCLDDDGIFSDSEKRIAAGEKLVKRLNSDGIINDRIIIDPLMLSESAEPGSAIETLKVIKHFHEIGIKTSLGMSNVSYGLPERKYINNAMLDLSFKAGLSCAILNTAVYRQIDSYLPEEKLAVDFLTGNDKNASNYIAHFKKNSQAAVQQTIKTDQVIDDIGNISKLVVDGNESGIEAAVKNALLSNPSDKVMNDGLINGLEIVGDLYNKGEYFLPQMIASANTMKKGFAVLKPLLSKEAAEKLGTVIISTVKGDIHDIGKNIVSMMLENHGFNVIDLGKDVDNNIIIENAVKENADIICLSSLLTTTMPEMETVAGIIKQKNLKMKLMVGGAVVSKEYAESIGAYYSRDAVEAAMVAKKIMQAQL